MASNLKPLMLESMLLDCGTEAEIATFNRLMTSRRKGAAVCYALRIIRRTWANLINRKDAVIVQGKSALEPQDDFFIKRIQL